MSGPLTGLPTQSPDGAFIYAVRFTDGTVKIGKTANSRSRIRNHACAANGFGFKVSDWWLSPPHRHTYASENRALALARVLVRNGGSQRGAEYFAGISFGDLVEQLTQLRLEAPAAPVHRGNKKRTWELPDGASCEKFVRQVQEIVARPTADCQFDSHAALGEQQRYRVFGRVVANARHQAGFTQESLAQELGLSRPTIQRLERGVMGMPGATIAFRVLNTVGLSLAPAVVALGIATIEDIAARPAAYA